MKHYLLVPALGLLIWTTASLKMSAFEPTTSADHTPVIAVKDEPDRIPEFPGGFEAFTKYASENINYPEAFVTPKIEAKVYLSFTVAKNGAIKNVKILRGAPQEEFNIEAIRFVENMPNWIPGIKDGKKVSMEVTLPLAFK